MIPQSPNCISLPWISTGKEVKWCDVSISLHYITDWFFQELQDTSEYVRQELKSLEEQQKALDKVGEKLEIELRRAMECKGTVDRIT